MTSKIAQQILQDQENRKQLTEDLRKTHFHDKSQYDPGMQSVSKATFVEHSLANVVQTKQQMKVLQKDLRSQHFKLGNDDSLKNYQSIAQNSFKEPTNFEQSKLSQAAKQDLRTHHFVFGYSKDQNQTENKSEFQNKPIDPEVTKNRQDQVNQLRKHNYQFGDNKNYYSSTYNETLNKQYNPESLKQGLSKQQITQQIVELRKTNLSVGNHNVDYQSETNKEFQNYHTKKSQAIDQDLRAHHYNLGTDKVEFKSQAQATYQGVFQKPDNSLITALSKDLRQGHFVLGDVKDIEISEAKSNFQEYDLSKNKIVKDKNRFQKAQFDIGQNGKFNEGGQDYLKQQEILKQLNPAIQGRNDRMDRDSHIILGSDVINDQFISENSKNFKDFSKDPAARGQLDDKLIKELKSHHYQFGNDPMNYSTQQKDVFVAKSEGRGFLNEEKKNDLRRNHFVYGTQQNDWETSKNQQFGNVKGESSKLDPKLAKDLRTHHFTLGNSDPKYISQQQATYIDWFKQ